MRKCIFVILLVSILLGGCGPLYMVSQKPCPNLQEIIPPKGKAALVIAKNTPSKYYNFNTYNYSDTKFIGTLKMDGLFTTIVDPGEYYISSSNDKNVNTQFLIVTIVASAFDSPIVVEKIKFEENKTYYIYEYMVPKFPNPDVKLVLTDHEHIYNELDGRCNYYSRDPDEIVPDLTADELQQRVALYKSRIDNINEIDQKGWTALMYAVLDGKAQEVRNLLNKGADPDIKAEQSNDDPERGTTALIVAAYYGNAEATEALLQKNADPNVIDCQGKKAIDYAREYKFDKCVALLEAAK